MNEFLMGRPRTDEQFSVGAGEAKLGQLAMMGGRFAMLGNKALNLVQRMVMPGHVARREAEQEAERQRQEAESRQLAALDETRLGTDFADFE